MEIARCMPRHPCSRYQRVCVPQSTSRQRHGSCKSALHNRDIELQRLDRLTQSQPNSITVILGPRSCGKTALLQSHLERKEKVLYFDCRGGDFTTPKGFVSAVLRPLLSKVPNGKQGVVQTILGPLLLALGLFVAGAKINWTDLQVSGLPGKEGFTFDMIDAVKYLQESNKEADPPRTLDAVLDVISRLLDAWNAPLSSQNGYERPVLITTEANKLQDSRKGDNSAMASNALGANKDPRPSETKYEYPVLVIDEANKLMEWRDEHKNELDTVLSFLVQISKQQNRCHVLLATSEYGFQAWMDKAIGAQFWQATVIGDFTEDHARKYLELKLQREYELQKMGDIKNWAPLDDTAWRKVYEVCGGNAGDLLRVSAGIYGQGLEAVLKSMYTTESLRVRKLALGVKGRWTPAQYREVVLHLLTSRYHALPQADVEIMLGQHVMWWKFWDVAVQRQAGEKVLQQLVEANALSVRPSSLWAEDIPLEAFGNDDAVVTAPSSLTLYCMSRVFRKGGFN